MNARRLLVKEVPVFGKDFLAALVASVVLIANTFSFAALMFPGELAVGIPIAIWAMLIGSCVGGCWIAWATSIPPLATGIDSPTGVVLVLLSSAAASRVYAEGGAAEAAVQNVMLIFTLTTFIAGALLYSLGVFRWGSYFRFVPYFVVGGFLAATGWFLVAGGVRMMTGRPLDVASLYKITWTPIEIAKFAYAITTAIVLLSLRAWIKSSFAMPLVLLLMWLAGTLSLLALGLTDPEEGWYFPSLGSVVRWSPFAATLVTVPDWRMTTWLLPEMLAVVVVAVISLVAKVTSLEVARQTSGDLNQEFRAHGIASLIAAPIGGLISNLQIGTSRLLDQAGGGTRMSGVICALIIGMVALASFDLPALIPIPIVAGLVFYLGCTFIVEAFWRPFAQRAWFDLSLAFGIMLVCVAYGYLTGILVGVVCACLLFVISYARVGVVRRHVTRAEFASNVDRSQEVSEYLRSVGDAIQIYWLTGYIFFGSSEGLFERIRGDIEGLPARSVAFVIIDFGMVSGTDSSAIFSLTKLQNYCDQKGTTLVYCSLPKTTFAILQRLGFFGDKSRHRAFGDLNIALAWCEDQLLARAHLDSEISLAGFEAWLQRHLGTSLKSADLLRYFERRDVDGTQILYRSGDDADTVDLVAAGNLAVDITKEQSQNLRMRRIRTHTVVGEMGFFRQSVRSATVASDGPATLFTLTRANFELMQQERPDLASAFYRFIIRMLADRVEFSNKVVASLSV